MSSSTADTKAIANIQNVANNMKFFRNSIFSWFCANVMNLNLNSLILQLFLSLKSATTPFRTPTFVCERGVFWRTYYFYCLFVVFSTICFFPSHLNFVCTLLWMSFNNDKTEFYFRHFDHFRKKKFNYIWYIDFIGLFIFDCYRIKSTHKHLNTVYTNCCNCIIYIVPFHKYEFSTYCKKIFTIGIALFIHDFTHLIVSSIWFPI